MLRDIRNMFAIVSIGFVVVSIGTYIYIHTKYIGTDTGPGYNILVTLTLIISASTFVLSLFGKNKDNKRAARVISLTILIPVVLFVLILAIYAFLLSRALQF